MLEISIRFLAGHFHATPWDRHPREGEPEWPPSPWRLVRALVASFYRTPEAFSQKEVLALLQELAAPPEYHLPTASAGHTRQYFPQSTPGDKQLLFDAFVVTGMEPQDVVVSRWPDLVLNDRQLSLLRQLLCGVSYFGRAESWAELSVSTIASDLPTNCSIHTKTAESEPVRMLGAEPDVTWQQLTVQTSQLHKEGWSSPPGSRWLSYHRRLDCFQTRTRQRAFDFDPVAIRYAYLRPLRPRRANALFASETLRTDFLALLKKSVDEDTWEAFAGKKADGTNCLNGHGHPYILPQPARGFDKFIDEIIVYRKPEDGRANFSESALEVFTRGVGRLQQLRLRAFKVQFAELLDEEGLKRLPQFQASRIWESQTPYVQTRHLKPGRETLFDQVRRELANHGGQSDLLQEIRVQAPSIDGVALREFRTQRRDRPRPAGGVHNLRLEFSQPVSGPIVLGYGAHCGLGQFRPFRVNSP